MSPPGRGGASGGVLGAVVALALALRLGRAALRWDEVALAYAAYTQPWADALARGDLAGALGTFVGLHPPLHAALHTAAEALAGAPLGWLALSVGASTAAVWALGRGLGAGAALVLAVDPLQLAYAAEVNNYPLLALALSLALWARERAARRGRWGALAAAGVLAGWTHLLGGLAVGLMALSLARRDPRAALGTLGAMAAGTAPVVVVSLSLAAQGSTYGQGGLDPAVLAAGLADKLGPWVLCWALAALGATRRPALAALALGQGAGVLALMGLGVAASHQQPYWLALGPPVAGLLGARPALALGAAALGLVALGPEGEALVELRADLARPRGIDAALAAAQPGDALWLLAPALMPDDDKRDRSPVLWRLPPTLPGRAWRGDGPAPAFEFTDHRFGQPRWMGPHIVHTSTDLHPGAFDAALGAHLAAGRRVHVLLYEHAPAFDYAGKLARALDPYVHRCVDVGGDRGLGEDRYCLVEGLR